MMQPRDIVTPSAAILGLILAAFGIVVTLAGEPQQVVVKNFALIFCAVVALFVCAVVFTIFSSLLRKVKLWNCALIFYTFGWGFLGSVMILVLVGYGFGIETLQLQFPQFSVELVTSQSILVGLILGALVSILLARRVSEYRRCVSQLSRALEVPGKEFSEALADLEMTSSDIRKQLEKLCAKITQQIRILAKVSGIEEKMGGPFFPLIRVLYVLRDEEILSSEITNIAVFVYQGCNRAIHGEVISENDARLIRELSLKTTVTLKKIVDEYSNK